MAILPLDQAIPRFQQNDDRLNTWVNGDQTTDMVTSGGQQVPSIRKIVATKTAEIDAEVAQLLGDKEVEINQAADGILAQSEAARDASIAARDASIVARDKSAAWAESPNEVEPGKRSAKYWAEQAQIEGVPDGSITPAKVAATNKLLNVFDAGTYPDIAALLTAGGRSTFGHLLPGRPSGHAAVAVYGNDNNDGFSVFTDQNFDGTLDFEAFRVSTQGNGWLAGQQVVTVGNAPNLLTYLSPHTGAVSRTLRDRLADFTSVKDFGAVGDGVADDTAAMQAAADSNKLCLVPPGTYRVTKTIIFDPTRNRGGGFIGWGSPSLYPDTTQGSGPNWAPAGDEPVILYDGPTVADLTATSPSTIGMLVGVRGFTTDTGKAFAVGQTVILRRTTDPNNTYMYGTVSSYNSGTGAMAVNVTNVSTTGSFSGWTITVPTAVVAVTAGTPLTIEPGASFDTTPYGYRFHDLLLHGNDKAQFGFYSARLQDGDLRNIIGYKCRGDGININGSYSGSYQALLGYRNWGRGISIGAADYDWGWTAQGSINRVTFFDLWGYVNGRAGEYNEASTTARIKGCGIFFGPHRGCSIVGWTTELNDGVGMVFAPTGNANVLYDGYTELNSSNDITGSGSAIATGRATEKRGILFYGAADAGSWNNTIEQAYLAGEKMWLAGTEPSTGRKGLFLNYVVASGTVAGWGNYYVFDGCDAALVTNRTGSVPRYPT